MTVSVAVPHHASATTLLALPDPPVISHISDGHRLLRQVAQHRDALYDSAQFHRAAVTLPAGQVMRRLVPALRAQISRRAADRITAAVQRAHQHAALYDVKLARVLFPEDAESWAHSREVALARLLTDPRTALALADKAGPEQRNLGELADSVSTDPARIFRNLHRALGVWPIDAEDHDW